MVSVARTARPSVWPTSLAPCVYVAFVAPWIDLQWAPAGRSGTTGSRKLIAPEPDQVPADRSAASAPWIVPVTSGGAVFDGPGATAIGAWRC